MWAWASRSHHNHFRPPAPEVNDEVAYWSDWLCDDSVVLEPLVGNRVYLALHALEHSMKAVWGEEAVNQDKKDEEGEPEAAQLIWGITMDFDDLTSTLPDPKRVKAQYLLAEPTLSRGHHEVTMRLMRELAGNAQYWSVTSPELNPHLPVLYAMLQQKEPGRWVNPPGSEKAVEAKWDQLWDFLDLCRLMFQREVSASFSTTFERMLPIRERLALPGFSTEPASQEETQ